MNSFNRISLLVDMAGESLVLQSTLNSLKLIGIWPDNGKTNLWFYKKYLLLTPLSYFTPFAVILDIAYRVICK